MSKFSKVQPCAAADGSRSATMPRLLPRASVNRAVTAFIHLSKEPERRLAQPSNVGQHFLRRMSEMGGSCHSLNLIRHPGLDPGSTAAPKSWTPDQVRGDEDEGPTSVDSGHSIQIGNLWREWGGKSSFDVG